jgi:O-antigen ligase
MPTAPPSLEYNRVDSPIHMAAEQSILFLACATLAFGVLAFGAVHEWSTCVLECGSALLFGLWAGYQVVLQRIRLTSKAVFPALLLLSLPILQLLTGRTAYAYATRYNLLQWLAYGVFFLIASEFSWSPVARKRLAISIAAFGSLYAIFSLIQGFIFPPNMLYGMVKTHGSGFGSYANRNHYAGLMEMLLPFGLVISSFRSVPRSLRVLSIFGSLVMLTSVFASRSRGGMLSVTIAMSVFAFYYWRHEHHGGRTRTLLIVLALSSAFVAYFAYDQVASRLVAEKGDSVRWQIARDSIHLAAQHPLIGSGLGTFTEVYPRVRSFPMDLFVNAAHNDYVQLVVETGFLGVLFTAAFLMLVFRNAFQQVRHTRKDWFSAVSLAAVIGMIALLVHSLTDFNLEIPANAATFAFLAGLASASSEQGRYTRKHEPA